MFKIEKNIPINNTRKPKNEGGLLPFLHKLEVGDSIFVAEDKMKKGTLAFIMGQFNKSGSKRCISRTVSTPKLGRRVWRTE